MKNKTSASFTRFALAAIFILFVCAIIVLAIQLSQVNEDAHNALISRIADHIQMTLQVYPKPIVENLSAVREMGKADAFNIKNITELTRHFAPLLEQYPHIYAAHIADDTGREYLIFKENGDWITIEGDIKKQQNTFYFKKWDKDLQLLDKWQVQQNYDPRERPWYKGVMAFSAKGGEAYWTPPHHFFGTRIPVVSAAVKWKSNSGKRVYVAAFDILLKEMLAFKDRLHVTETTKIFLIHPDNSITDLSLKKLLSEVDEKMWGRPQETDDPATSKPQRQLLDLALAQWQASGKTPNTSFVIQDNGTRWWGGFRSLSVSGEQLQVAVLVPENELAPDAWKRQRLIFMMASAILMIVIALTILVYRKMSRSDPKTPFPLRSLYRTEEGLLSLIEKGESDTLEFKSTMRWNLKTDKAGKEIELAWLKTVAAYMNSHGGLLTIGVTDSGVILGLEADRFQNDDKCLLHFNNLIKQHIGLDFSQFIHFEIKKAGEQKIFVVECIPADAPVFLKTGKGEEFYVRSGPSSIRLSMSEMLNYLNQKGNAS